MAIPRMSVFKKRPHVSRVRLWSVGILVLSLLNTLQPSHGLQISLSSVSPTYAAVGKSVTLHCHFSLAPEDVGHLDIEWSIRPVDISEDQTVVIWYAANRIYGNYDPFGSRIQFVSPNPRSGNASITISYLKMEDTNTFQCLVRKLPGIQSSIIHLEVMEMPTTPECYVEGEVELDQSVELRCKGSQGSPPIWYSWSMDDQGKRLPGASIALAPQGDLVLTITEKVAPGILVCTAQNLVGKKSCLVTLSLKNSRSVEISGVSVAVGFLIGITAIIVFCYRKRRVESCGNEIFMDEPPPHRWLSKKNRQDVPSQTAREAVKTKKQEDPKEKDMREEEMTIKGNY